MPVTSTRAQWDEGLRTVRQFNDLLRVLPPLPQAAAGQPVARRSGSPSRPLTPAPARVRSRRPEPTSRPAAPTSAATPLAPRPAGPRRDAPTRCAGHSRRPTDPRNGRQSAHYPR